MFFLQAAQSSFNRISAAEEAFWYVAPAIDDRLTHVSLGIGLKSNGDSAELCVKEESSVEGQSGFYESGHQENLKHYGAKRSRRRGEY